MVPLRAVRALWRLRGTPGGGRPHRVRGESTQGELLRTLRFDGAGDLHRGSSAGHPPDHRHVPLRRRGLRAERSRRNLLHARSGNHSRGDVGGDRRGDPRFPAGLAPRPDRRTELVLAEKRPKDPAHALDALDDDVGLDSDLLRSLFARHADSQNLPQPSLLAQPLQLAKGIEICGVIAHEYGLLRAILLDQGAYGGAFVRPDGRTRLDDAAAYRDPESQAFSFALHELY